MAVILRNGNKQLHAFAFCDEGSNGSSIEEAVASELNLHSSRTDLHVKFTGQSFTMESSSMKVELLIVGCYKGARSIIL